MTRQKIGNLLVAVASVGFIGTAALHATGYDSVTQASTKAPGNLSQLVPMLWIAISFDLTVIGLMVAVIAFQQPHKGSLILFFAALCPVALAGLQVWYLGLIPPTALLLGLAAVTLAPAVIHHQTAPSDPPPPG